MVTITMPKFTVSSVAAILAVLVDGGLCRFAGGGSVGRLSGDFTLYGLGEDKSSELTDVFPESNGVQHGTQSDEQNGIDGFNNREYSVFGNEIRHDDDGYKPGAQEPGAQEPGVQEPGVQEPDGDDDGAGQNYYDDDKDASIGFDKDTSHIAPAKYITGGSATGVALYPWVVRLIIKHEVKGKIMWGSCGGSLVSWRHVITAAHCVKLNIKNNVDVSVYLAEYNTRTFPVDCDGSQCVENFLMHPDKIIIHPQYQREALHNNDIALLRLSQYAPNNGYIRPIALPTFNVNDRRYEGAPVVVTGWGLTEYGQMSPIKLHAQVELVAPETCRRHYPVTEGMLCAAGRNGKNKCSGDSGGPLMAQYDGKLHLVGLVSFRLTTKCTTYMPSMYTNVYSYLEWIKKSMSN